MSDRLIYQFLSLLLVFVAAVSSGEAQHAQTDPDAVEEEETAEPAEPEPPKQVMHIEVKDHLLTVEVENVDFATVIRSIADKANFRIQGTGSSFGKKLNTKFSNTEIERGVSRLFTLVKESNYLIHYDEKGDINTLEIYSSVSGSPVVSGIRTRSQPPVRPSRMRQRGIRIAPDEEDEEQPRTRPVPVVRPQMPSSVQPPGPANIRPVPVRRPIPVPVQPTPQAVPDDESAADEEEIEEVPYVPSQTAPRFTPKK